MFLRAYELAKQLGIPTQRLVEKSAEIGIVLHNNFATITSDEAERIFKYLTTGEVPPVQVEALAPELSPAVSEAKQAAEEQAREAKLKAAATTALFRASCALLNAGDPGWWPASKEILESARSLVDTTHESMRGGLLRFHDLCRLAIWAQKAVNAAKPLSCMDLETNVPKPAASVLQMNLEASMLRQAASVLQQGALDAAPAAWQEVTISSGSWPRNKKVVGTIHAMPEDAFASLSIKPEAAFSEHRAAIRGVAFSPDGRMLASAGADKKVVLRAHTQDFGWELLREFSSGSDINGTQFSPDGRLVAYGDVGGNVWLARIPSDSQICAPEEPVCVKAAPDACYSVAFHPTKPLLVVGTRDKAMLLMAFDPDASPLQLRIVRMHKAPGAVRAARFTSDGRAMMCVDESGHFGCVGIKDNSGNAHFYRLSKDSLFSLDCHPKRNYVVIGGDDNCIQVWNCFEGNEQPVAGACLKRKDEVWATRFSPDGSMVMFGDGDGEVGLWAWSRSAIRETWLHDKSDQHVYGVDVAPDCSMVASGTEDGTVKLWATGYRSSCKPAVRPLEGSAGSKILGRKHIEAAALLARIAKSEEGRSAPPARIPSRECSIEAYSIIHDFEKALRAYILRVTSEDSPDWWHTYRDEKQHRNQLSGYCGSAEQFVEKASMVDLKDVLIMKSRNGTHPDWGKAVFGYLHQIYNYRCDVAHNDSRFSEVSLGGLKHCIAMVLPKMQ